MSLSAETISPEQTWPLLPSEIILDLSTRLWPKKQCRLSLVCKVWHEVIWTQQPRFQVDIDEDTVDEDQAGPRQIQAVRRTLYLCSRPALLSVALSKVIDFTISLHDEIFGAVSHAMTGGNFPLMKSITFCTDKFVDLERVFDFIESIRTPSLLSFTLRPSIKPVLGYNNKQSLGRWIKLLSRKAPKLRHLIILAPIGIDSEEPIDFAATLPHLESLALPQCNPLAHLTFKSLPASLKRLGFDAEPHWSRIWMNVTTARRRGAPLENIERKIREIGRYFDKVQTERAAWLAVNTFAIRLVHDDAQQARERPDPSTKLLSFVACSVVPQCIGDFPLSSMRELLSLGAPVNPSWPGHFFSNVLKPLYLIIQEKPEIPLIRLLLEFGADPASEYTQATPVTEAITACRVNIVKEFVSLKNLVSAAEKLNCTPEGVLNNFFKRLPILCYAAARNAALDDTVEVLDYLWNDLNEQLEAYNGFSIRKNCYSESGLGPLHSVQSVPAARWLLEKGFDLGVISNKGLSCVEAALIKVVNENESTDLLEFLVEQWFSRDLPLPAAGTEHASSFLLAVLLSCVKTIAPPKMEALLAHSCIQHWRTWNIVQGYINSGADIKPLIKRLENIGSSDLTPQSRGHLQDMAKRLRPDEPDQLIVALEEAAAKEY